MRRALLLPTAALAGALTLGCADQPSPTGMVTDPLAPSLGAEHVPVFSPVLLGGDPGNPLAVQAGYEAGLTAEDICPDTGEHVDPNSREGPFHPTWWGPRERLRSRRESGGV